MELSHPHFTKRLIRSNSSEHTKPREVWEPNKEARQVHRKLAKRVTAAYLAPLTPDDRLNFAADSAKGGIPGSTVVDVVRCHAANKGYHFMMTDLSHAYDSVDGERLAEQLVRLGVFDDSEAAHNILDEYCIHPSGTGLLQGGPASPALFNVSCIDLDANLRGIANHHGLAYARYMDDLSFSANKERGPIGKHKRRAVFKAIAENGWDIAHHKTRVVSLPTPVTMLGISYYKTGYWQMSPTLVNKVSAALGALEEKLDRGEDPTLHDIGVIDGYHGVITSTHDDRRGQPTPLEAKLLQRYRDLRLRAEPLLGKQAVVNRDAPGVVPELVVSHNLAVVRNVRLM